MIRSTMNKGFSMTFDNGYTISVQFGRYNYCENKFEDDFNKALIKGLDGDLLTCENAEIAIWNKDNVWYDFGMDTVKGWCNANEVAEWIEKVSKWK